jgi:hypothetical protein
MTEDAQRELQQHSLRNVRALLDKLEGEAEIERRTRRWIAVALVAVTVVLFGVVVFATRPDSRAESRTIVGNPVGRPATLPEPAPK